MLSSQEKDDAICRQLEHIRSLCNPERIVLFGSAVNGIFDEDSDLDFVLTFSSVEAAQLAQKVLYRSKKPSTADYVCVDEQTYQVRSNVGGVFFVARTEGRDLTSMETDPALANI